MSQRGTQGCIELNGTSYEAHNLRQATGLEFQHLFGDGQLDPTFAALLDALPVVTFATYDVGALLALNSNKFLIEGVSMSQAFNAYFRNQTADGTVASTGDKYSLTNGIVIPTRLAAGHKAIAVMECVAIGRSGDKTTAALSRTADQNVPSVTTGSRYLAGKCEANGTQVNEIQMIEVMPNIQLRGPLGGDGQPYADHVGIDGRQPTISIVSQDLDAAATLDVSTGLRQTATDSEVYFRKIDGSGTRVAAGTAEHIKLTIPGNDSPMWIEELATAQGQVVGVSINYAPIWDTSNQIVSISAASAIS